MVINSICFIVPHYPTEDDPVYTFVRQLICEISDRGIKCSVIAPQSITHVLKDKNKKRPYFWTDETNSGSKIDVWQPSYVSFYKIRMFGVPISPLLNQQAIIKCFKKNNINPDIVYAHFWHSGISAGIIGGKYNIPVFIASGESKIWIQTLFKEKKIQKKLRDVKGVICVSQKNMQESIDLKLASKENMIVIPNAINSKLFHKIDRVEARKKLGFHQEDFIVIFVGSFNHRKGVLRLSEAIKKSDGIKSIFIGSGNLQPDCEGILFKGKVSHEEVLLYLNAADVFVLPTLAEGCCNAIIEAMACGLPIISSDLSFNDDILDENNSIRVDSNNIDEIALAIDYLKNNANIREKKSKASIVKAKDLNIGNRINRILQFIDEKR